MTAINTVEYAWAHINTATAENTVFTSADITVNIPENTSRAFVSCILDIVVHDNEATVADDLAAANMGASCDAGTTWTDRNVTTTLADSGEQMSYHFRADVTAEFTARFSGVSDTVRFRLQCDYSTVGNQFLNIAAKVIITYTFDESAQTTRLKTARIPLDALTARPTAGTATSLGATCIPNLDTFLPEASKTYRAIFAEIWLNTAPGATGDGTLTLDLNTTPTMTTGTIENGNSSPILIRILWDLLAAAMTTNATHELRFTPNTTAMGVAVGGWITVTYEYDHSSNNDIMSSLLIPLGPPTDQLLTSGDLDEWEGEFFIEEPATVALAQSGVVLFALLGTTAATLSLLAGGQAARTYTLSQQSGQAGGCIITQRIDSGGVQGAGITLARGRNTFSVQVYSSVANAIGCVSGFLILNYTSGKASSGAQDHNRSIHKVIADTQAVVSVNRNASFLLDIPQTNYWLNGFMAHALANLGALGAPLSVQAEYAAGEGGGAGWAILGQANAAQVAERYMAEVFYDGTPKFNRYPGDVRDLLDVEVSRTYRLMTAFNSLLGFSAWITYHALTFTLSGNVRGYTGDGSSITVDVFRDDTDEKLYTTTTSAGGSYSVTLYDDTLTYYAVARQDDTHMGRSKNGTPATDFHIQLQGQVLPMRALNTLARM